MENEELEPKLKNRLGKSVIIFLFWILLGAADGGRIAHGAMEDSAHIGMFYGGLIGALFGATERCAKLDLFPKWVYITAWVVISVIIMNSCEGEWSGHAALIAGIGAISLTFLRTRKWKDCAYASFGMSVLYCYVILSDDNNVMPIQLLMGGGIGLINAIFLSMIIRALDGDEKHGEEEPS